MKKRIILSVCGVLAAAVTAVVIYFCIPKPSDADDDCYFTVSSSVSVEVGKTAKLSFTVTPDKSAISFENKTPQIFSAQMQSNKIIFSGLNVGNGIFVLYGKYKSQEFSCEIAVVVTNGNNQNPDASKPTDPTIPTDPSNPTDTSDPTKPSEPDNPANPDDPTDPTDPTQPNDPSEDDPKPTYPTTDAIKFKNMSSSCKFVDNQFLLEGKSGFVTLICDFAIAQMYAYKVVGEECEELTIDMQNLFLPYENFELKIVVVAMDGTTYVNRYQVLAV